VAINGATSCTLPAGQTHQVAWTVSPANATNKNVVFSTNNVAVATVSQTGLVTAVGAGTCLITVTTTDSNVGSNFYASVNVTVTANLVTKIEIYGDTNRIVMGSSTTLTAKVYGADGKEGTATNNAVVWTIEPATGIGTITSQNNSSCTVKGDNPGVLTIVCKARDASGIEVRSSITVTLT